MAPHGGGGAVEDQVVIRVRGELAGSKRLAVSELARIVQGIQGSLERLALITRGRSSSNSGRRPADVVGAMRLYLADYQPGSANLVLDHHGQDPLFGVGVDETLQALLSGLSELDGSVMPAGWDAGVVGGLVELTGSLGSGIDSIEIAVGNRPATVIDRNVKDALRRVRRDGLTELRKVTGRLSMGDFAPVNLKCRIDLPGRSVLCDFEPELRSVVLALMDRFVTADGAAELDAVGNLRILHIEAIEPFALQDGAMGLDELIDAQSVRPISDIKTLSGEPIDDFDEFVAAVHSKEAT